MQQLPHCVCFQGTMAGIWVWTIFHLLKCCASAFREFYFKKMFEGLLLIPFPKQSKSLKTHTDPISLCIRKTFIYWMWRKSTYCLKTTTKVSWSISDDSETVVPNEARAFLVHWNCSVGAADLSVRQNCATDTSAIKTNFSNGHVFYKDFFFFKSSFHPHLLNMTYSLYQPVKPTLKSISVVSCKIHSGRLGS